MGIDGDLIVLSGPGRTGGAKQRESKCELKECCLICPPPLKKKKGTSVKLANWFLITYALVN